MVTLIDRIRQLRAHLGLNQTDMAKLLSISQAQYSKIEKGVNMLTMPHLDALIQKTDINIGWLLTGDGPMTRSSDGEVWFNDLKIGLVPLDRTKVDIEKRDALAYSIMHASGLPLLRSDMAFNILLSYTERLVKLYPDTSTHEALIPAFSSGFLAVLEVFQQILFAATQERAFAIEYRGIKYSFAR